MPLHHQQQTRRVEEGKEEASTDDVASVGQELALDVTLAPSTPPHANLVAWLPLTELNNNSGALLPPFQLHMLEMHLTLYIWELFHDSCVSGRHARP